jgi:phosphoglycolate phosphatase
MQLAPLSHFQAAIIDLDGTLVDTLGDFEAALSRMLADLSLPPLERQAIEPMVGKGSEHLIRSALAAAGGAAQSYESAWAAYQRHYQQINGHFSAVYPGVGPGLAALREAGLRLACVTNKPRRFAIDLLALTGLGAAFAHVFGGDDFPHKKPHPMPLLKACEALDSDPARTLMVGDSTNDAQAARAAGCPVVLVTYGYNHGRPITEADADGWIDSLADLPRRAGRAG